MPEATSTLFVARGHTVMTGRQDGTGAAPVVANGPGTMLTLPLDEARRLTALGFLQDTPPSLAAPKPENPSSVGLHVAQGPDFSR
jgi:hypothetical protein